jgi:hypothetical protein
MSAASAASIVSVSTCSPATDTAYIATIGALALGCYVAPQLAAALWLARLRETRFLRLEVFGGAATSVACLIALCAVYGSRLPLAAVTAPAYTAEGKFMTAILQRAVSRALLSHWRSDGAPYYVFVSRKPSAVIVSSSALPSPCLQHPSSSLRCLRCSGMRHCRLPC